MLDGLSVSASRKLETFREELRVPELTSLASELFGEMEADDLAPSKA